MICSWSMSDYMQIFSEVQEKVIDIAYDFLFENLRDVQREFGDGIRYSEALSLKNTMSSIDEKFEGKAHNALVDAENTAALVELLSNKKLFNKRTKTLQEL